MIIYGHNLYGRVNDVVVDGRPLCYVVTRFYHVYFLPILPVSSHIVLSGSEDGETFKGVPIPLSGSSICVAWLRTFCLFLILFGICSFFAADPNHVTADRAISVLEVFAGVVFYAFSNLIGRPSPDRVVELLQHLGVVQPDLLAEASPARHAEAGMSPLSMLVHGCLGLGIIGMGYASYSYLTRPPSPAAAAVNATATPSPTPTVSNGESYLKKSRDALKAKQFRDAAIQGDLAAEFLKNEKAAAGLRVEAHKLAGQAYYRRKEYPKALTHYKALQALEPANKQHPKVIAELAQHIPAEKPKDLRLTPEQMRRREEARLNRVIRVRLLSAYETNSPYSGTVVSMTVREYERRKSAGELR